MIKEMGAFSKTNHSANQALRRTLLNSSRPYLKDLTTPIIGDHFKDVLIDGDLFSINTDRPKFIQQVLNLIKKSSLAMDSRIYELEIEEARKAGPSSLRPSRSWWDGISAFFDIPHLRMQPSALERAHQTIFRRIGHIMNGGYFKPLSDVKLPMSHFSGMPHLTRTDLCYLDILKDAEDIRQQISEGKEFEYYPSVLGHRGQPKGMFQLPKQRIVWQYPKAPVLVGLAWLQVVQPLLADLDEFVGWNHWSRIDDVVNRMVVTAHYNRTNIVSMDFSQFDATVSPTLILPLFENLGLKKMLLPILHDFFSSSIILPDGIMSGRVKGVPSGHAWTNFVDCLANLTCIYYIAEVTGRQVLSCTVLGDDSLVVYDKPVGLNEMSEIAAELGLKLNADKSIASDDHCHFLQKLYMRGNTGGGIRSIARTANSMATMERWDSEVDDMYHTCRWWSQLDEIRFHPARSEFLEFVRSIDKRHLGANNPQEVAAAMPKYQRLKEDEVWRGPRLTVPEAYWFVDQL